MSGITGLAVGGGTVFATNSQYFGSAPTFRAVDQTTGTTLWTKQFTNITSTSAPAYANGTVYFQTDGHSAIAGNFVHAYAARTGTSKFDASYDAQWETYLNPTPYNGNVYVGGGYYGGMYSFNGTTGQQKWFGSVPQYDGWTPAIDGTYAYSFTGSGSTTPISGVFRMINMATGATAATVVDPTYNWDGYTMNNSVVLGAAHDAFGVHSGRLTSWDTTLDATHTPHIAWIKAGSYSGQATLANGKLFVNNGGALNVLDEATGNLLWTWNAPTGSLAGTTIATDNMLFVQNGASTYGIDLTSHTATWSYPAAGVMALSEGILYVGASNGSLYAVGVPEPTAMAVLGIGAILLRRRRR